MPADLSRNYVAVEATETVTFCVKTSEAVAVASGTPAAPTSLTATGGSGGVTLAWTDGGFEPAEEVEFAKRRAPSKVELQAAGALLHSVGLTWHLWKSQMPAGVVPKMGDVIQDEDGVRWTVAVVIDVQSLTERYRCVTLQER